MSRFAALGVAVVVMSLSPGLSEAKSRHPAGGGTAPSGGASFDYYVLSLSWSPEYCAAHHDSSSDQCRPGTHHGFMVHGLWPEKATGRTPTCSGSGKVPPDLVQKMLAIMPAEFLVQHEWKNHGACSGFSMSEYFGKVTQAYQKIHIPEQLAAPSASLSSSVDGIEKLFADANPGLAGNEMGVLCDNGTALAEIRICLDKELNFRTCGSGVSDRCGSKVNLVPVK